MFTRSLAGVGIVFLAFLFLSTHVYAFVGIQSPAPLDMASSFVPAGVDASGANSITFTPDGKYHLNYFQNGNLVTEYLIDTQDINVSRGLLQIKENVSQAVVMEDAGVRFHSSGYKTPIELANMAYNRVFQHQLFGNVLVLYYRETTNNPTVNFQVTTERQYEFRIQGPTMLITIRDLAPNHQDWGNFAGITLGNSDNMPNYRAFPNLPHTGWVIPVLFGSPGNERFFSAYWDLTKSNANDYADNLDIYGEPLPFPTPPQCSHTNPDPNCPPPSTGVFASYYNFYRKNLANYVQPLYEQVYVTVSPKIQDTLMSIHYAASPRVDDLRKRVVLDIFHMPYQNGLAGNSFFARAGDYVQKMYDWGMRDLFVITHMWQQYGYDCGLPDTAPANNGISFGTLPWGGTQGMQSLSTTALSHNFLFALHENYDTMMENTALFNTNDIALDYYGNLFNFPPISSCASGPNAYHMSLASANTIAANETAQIESLYSPNASYNDVLPANNFRTSINYSGTDPSAASFAAVYQSRKQLFNTIKSTYNGPLVGEGLQDADDSAQYFDNVEGVLGSIQRGQYALVVPEFSLKQLHPVRANQGMGTPETFFTDSFGNYIDIQNPLNWPSDDWHSNSILYGNVGIISEIGFVPAIRAAGSADIGGFFHNAVTEYYLMRGIQEEYGFAHVTSIDYLNSNSAYVDVSQALIAGFNSVDVNHPKMRVLYDNGLQVFVNQSPSQWNVSANGTTYYLPQFGWVAFNPNTNFFEYSGLMDAQGNPSASGSRKDIVRAPNALDPYTYADGRGVSTTFGLGYDNLPFTTSRVRVQKPNGFQLQEGSALGSFTPSTFSISTPALSAATSVPSPIVQGSSAALTFTGSNLFGVTSIVIGGINFPVTPASNSSISLSLSSMQTNSLQVGSNAIVLKVNSTNYPQSQTLQVNAAPPIPIISSLSPSSVALGVLLPTLTINGSNFQSNPTVFIGSASYPVTNTTPTQITLSNLQFNAPAYAANTTYNVVVTNASGAVSAPVPFTITSPPLQSPTIASVSPNAIPINSPAVITITGTNFSSSTIIKINNISFIPTFNSSTVLHLSLSVAQTLSIGTGIFSLRAQNGSLSSAAVNFTVNALAPTLSVSSPANNAAFTQGAAISFQGNITQTYSESAGVEILLTPNGSANESTIAQTTLTLQNGSTPFSIVFNPSIPLSSGNYQWRVRVSNFSNVVTSNFYGLIINPTGGTTGGISSGPGIAGSCVELSVVCANQVGVCNGSSASYCAGTPAPVCSSNTYGLYTPNFQLVESACSDGLDNDCDGQTDAADSDCAIITPPVCGDNVCSASAGETCVTCTVDCGSCQVNPPANNNGSGNGGGGGGDGGGSSSSGGPSTPPHRPSTGNGDGNPSTPTNVDTPGNGSASGNNPSAPSNGDSIFHVQDLPALVGQSITGNAADTGLGTIVLALVSVGGLLLVVQFFFRPFH